jgi:hypothetical protein
MINEITVLKPNVCTSTYSSRVEPFFSNLPTTSWARAQQGFTISRLCPPIFYIYILYFHAKYYAFITTSVFRYTSENHKGRHLRLVPKPHLSSLLKYISFFCDVFSLSPPKTFFSLNFSLFCKHLTIVLSVHIFPLSTLFFIFPQRLITPRQRV